MTYLYNDSDLEFLSKCSDSDLEDLVYCLTHNIDGTVRTTRELTNSDNYQEYFPQHSKYWEEIAAEIHDLGTNTFAKIFMAGVGVSYKRVLLDICDKMKVNYNSHSPIERIEHNLLSKILEDALEKMDPNEIKELATTLGLENMHSMTRHALLGALQAIFRMGGFKPYQLTVTLGDTILKALIGRGLLLAENNVALPRTMFILTGAIDWVITRLWADMDSNESEYKTTIAIVIQIIVLRQKVLYGNIPN
uniref:Uncharacterized protein n=1 Tax=Histophilus somni (strain 129Pt) TaxID=205914 RepID=Q0I3C8_HISS1